MFGEEDADEFPPDCPTDCAIKLIPRGPLLRTNLYSMSKSKWRELSRFIEKSFPQAAPVLFVKKNDGRLRLGTDYRGLNAVSMSNTYPILLSKDLLGEVAKGKFFTKLYLWNAYFQVQIREGD